jgi:hypothetical protein
VYYSVLLYFALNLIGTAPVADDDDDDDDGFYLSLEENTIA